MDDNLPGCGFTRSETLGTLIIKKHHIGQLERTILSRAHTIARLLSFSGTTVDVPTSGALSGKSSPNEEPSVLPQTDTPVAADNLVARQQGQQRGFLPSQGVHAMGC
ncbi:MAG: hypothetical protein K9I85_06365 [Saprospiraceae bacterium]|nr:hypothetical protein [Saprospiraceae bacterium]